VKLANSEITDSNVIAACGKHSPHHKKGLLRILQLRYAPLRMLAMTVTRQDLNLRRNNQTPASAGKTSAVPPQSGELFPSGTRAGVGSDAEGVFVTT
jgi:hypothetical protein